MINHAQKINLILLNISLLCVLWLKPAVAQKYTAEFLSIGVGAKALGMGGAYVAIANDGSAVFWNPAGLAQLPKREISLMHSSRFSGLVHANFVSLVLPDKNQNAFGLSYLRIGIEDIPKSTKLDQNDRPIIEGYFNDTEHAVLFSFARQSTADFYFGANLKTIHQVIGDHSSLGFGLDFGALYKYAEHLKFGIMLQDLTGTYVFWDTGKRDIRYPALQWGVAIGYPVRLLAGKITVAASQNIRFEGKNVEDAFAIGEIAGSDFLFGAEYILMNSVALRVGVERSFLTAGAGFSFGFFEIDYAYVSHDLGNSHRISGRIMF